jgi:hypothetical protein
MMRERRRAHADRKTDCRPAETMDERRVAEALRSLSETATTAHRRPGALPRSNLDQRRKNSLALPEPPRRRV